MVRVPGPDPASIHNQEEPFFIIPIRVNHGRIPTVEGFDLSSDTMCVLKQKSVVVEPGADFLLIMFREGATKRATH